ncbi:fibroblast growth factor receptor-like 1 [Nephila pilipes]|uniref:receptor protein-tyrosine kinase n=1 Tax=Nephila pilipes TaxID=299642 RepID=A0A8X6QCE3_NEPPI|nr:fibroblast growth factor receptor-like 1 [Nephila pilipes]
MENDLKSIVSLLPLIPFICAAAAINSLGPPRLVPEAYVMERIVPEGAKVQLPCPVQADPDTLFFEWYRGNEPLNIFHEDRFRVQSNGVLKIKSTVPQDSGVYICRAVNGFGKVDTNVTLVVLASGDSDYDPSGIYKHGDREPPYMINVTRTTNGHLSRPAGGSVRLLCKAVGMPEPQVTWLKNGQPLNTSFSSGSKRSRWSLYFRNLQDEDQGNYTCVAYNLYGHRNYTVALDVIPGDRKKPELRGIHPVNTTVEEGGSAVFQCRVKSEIIPHVQWLKQADPNEDETDGKVIKVHGEYFRILKSTEVQERPDGSFINKLILNGVSKKDAGKYICLGANTIGYSFRSAFLTIRGTSETFIAEMENMGNDTFTIQFSSIFITIPVVLAILITFLAVVFLHYYHKPRADQSGLQAKYDGKTEKAVVAPPTVYPHVHDVSIMSNPNFHHALESSDGTWSHVQSSLVIDPGQPDSFSECDSSFVFLGDLNMYPDIMYKDNGHVLSLYSPNPSSHEKTLCLDRV